MFFGGRDVEFEFKKFVNEEWKGVQKSNFAVLPFGDEIKKGNQLFVESFFEGKYSLDFFFFCRIFLLYFFFSNSSNSANLMEGHFFLFSLAIRGRCSAVHGGAVPVKLTSQQSIIA